MPLPVYRYRIELQASTYPREVWTTVRRPQGGLYRFVEEEDARAQLAKLLATQPHAKYRIAGC